MKKIYLVAALTLFTYLHAISQIWTNLGPDDENQPSFYQADYTSMATAPDGSVFIAYADARYGNKVTVSKFVSGSWSIVGTPGFTASAVNYVDIAVAGDGTPYIIYQTLSGFTLSATVMRFVSGSWGVVQGSNPNDIMQQFNFGVTGPLVDMAIGPAPSYIPYVAYADLNTPGGDATVKKFESGTWAVVGTAGFTGNATPRRLSLAVASTDGVPYLLFEDNSGSGSGRATVMRFDGSNWIVVGGRGFSHVGNGDIEYPSIAISGGDYAVYVAYRDNTNSNEVTVKRCTNPTDITPSWATLGIEGFSDVDADYVSLAVTSGGTPYVGYRAASNNRARVEVFDGSSWDDATPGTPDISSGITQYIAIALGTSNTPYIVYRDASVSQKASVKKLEGGSWIGVGNNGLSQGGAMYTSGALSNDGSFYVAYRDVVNGNSATVKKYASGTWSTVPSAGDVGFSGGAVEYVSLAINPVDGKAYVAFRDGANGNEATVYAEAPDGWGLVGLPAFSAGAVTYTSLAFNASRTPYIAFADAANSNEVTVMSYNGASWVNVGTAGFSNTGAANFVSLAIAPDGTPYVAYQSSGTTDKISVRRFAAGNWSLVGTDGFSVTVANHISLAINSAGVPYVAYQNGNGGKAIVQMFNGSSWATVGVADFSDGAATFFSLKFDNTGVPAVAYRDVANADRLTVKKLVTGTWTTQGSQGVSAGAVNNVSMAVDATGTIYVAYTDGYAWAQTFGNAVVLPVTLTDFIVVREGSKAKLQWQTASETNSDYFIVEHSITGREFSALGRVAAAGSSTNVTDYSFLHHSPAKGWNYYRLRQVDMNGKETIYPVRTLNFGTDNLVNALLYPNPAKDRLVVQTSASIKEIIITNAAGQRVLQQTAVDRQNKELNIVHLKTGVYFLTVFYGEEKTTLRFIKE